MYEYGIKSLKVKSYKGGWGF